MPTALAKRLLRLPAPAPLWLGTPVDHRNLSLSPPETWVKTIVTNVHDGDTISVDVDRRYMKGRDAYVGFNDWIVANHNHHRDSVRLYGLNAPELATPAGKTSQAALAQKLPLGTTITLTTWQNRNDKYGRILAGVMLGTVDINQWLIDNGYAIYWDGSGPKPVPTPTP